MAKEANIGMSSTLVWDEEQKLFPSQYDLCRNNATKYGTG